MGEFTCLAENPVVYLWFDLLCYSRTNAEEANLLNLKESDEKHKTWGCDTFNSFSAWRGWVNGNLKGDSFTQEGSQSMLFILPG